MADISIKIQPPMVASNCFDLWTPDATTSPASWLITLRLGERKNSYTRTLSHVFAPLTHKERSHSEEESTENATVEEQHKIYKYWTFFLVFVAAGFQVVKQSQAYFIDFNMRAT